MSLQEILDLVNFIVSKEQEGNTMSPKQYNDLLPFCVNDVYNTYIYRLYDTEQKFTDASLPFKVFMGQESYVDGNGVTIPAIPPLMIDDNGYANIPKDYKHYSALKFKKAKNKPDCETEIKFKNVVVLTDQEYDAYQNSSLKKATHKNPVCNFQNGFIRFAPRDLKYVNFVYLKTPRTPVYAYTINPITQLVTYDPANSVELEFRYEEQCKLVVALLERISINLEQVTVEKYAEQQSQKNLVV